MTARKIIDEIARHPLTQAVIVVVVQGILRIFERRLPREKKR